MHSRVHKQQSQQCLDYRSQLQASLLRRGVGFLLLWVKQLWVRGMNVQSTTRAVQQACMYSNAVRHLHMLQRLQCHSKQKVGGMQKVGGGWECTWEAKPGGCRPRAARALSSCVALPAPQNLTVYPCSCASPLPHPSNSSRVLHTRNHAVAARSCCIITIVSGSAVNCKHIQVLFNLLCMHTRTCSFV